MLQEKENQQFKEYTTERLVIDSIRSRLSRDENVVRNSIMEQIIVSGRSCSLSQLQIEGVAEPDRHIDKLLEKRVIVVDEVNQEVNFAYPVSALPTPHQVVLEDGNSFFAMCAIDALGAAFTFNQDTRIISQCAECGEKVLVEVKGQKLVHFQPDSLHILHADLSNSDNWAGSC